MTEVSPEVLATGTPLSPGDPETLGPYRLLRRLGQGGMGTVYLSSGPGGRLVAVKVIREDYARLEEFRRRFQREAANARRVARFCTAEVLDVDSDGHKPYLVTEFVEGSTLSRVVATGGPLSAANLERLAVGVAAALTAIHGAGIVHRDLKPGNVMLSPFGPRVIDFGIARAQDAAVALSDVRVGTPAFMAPEQILGEQLTGAVDIFAWGAVVAYAGTGHYPFGDTTDGLFYRVIQEPPQLTGLDGFLRPIVERAMSKSPSARPSATELLFSLLGNTDVPAADDAETAVTHALTGWVAPDEPETSITRLPTAAGTPPSVLADPPAVADAPLDTSATTTVYRSASAAPVRTPEEALPGPQGPTATRAGTSAPGGETAGAGQQAVPGQAEPAGATAATALAGGEAGTGQPTAGGDTAATALAGDRGQAEPGTAGAGTAGETAATALAGSGPSAPGGETAATALAGSGQADQGGETAATALAGGTPPAPRTGQPPAAGGDDAAATALAVGEQRQPGRAAASRAAPKAFDPEGDAIAAAVTGPPTGEQQVAAGPANIARTRPQSDADTPTGLAPAARPDGPDAPPADRRRRRLPLLIAAAVVVIVVGVVLGVTLGGKSKNDNGGSSAPAASTTAAFTIPKAATPLPDDTMVVALKRDGGDHLFPLSQGGTVGKALTSGTQQQDLPAVSPDRKTIAYYVYADRSMWLIGSDGSGNEKMLHGSAAALKPDNDARPSWDHDGDRVVFAADGPQGEGLYVVRLATGEFTKLPTQARVGDPAWSPNDKVVLYWSGPGDGGALFTISTVDPTATPQQLTKGGPNLDADPAWAPNGQHIAFRRVGPGTTGRDIFAMRSDGTHQTDFTPGVQGDQQDPSYSPDNLRIAYSSEQTGQRVTFTMKGDGTDHVQVPNQKDRATTPSWSSGRGSGT